MGRISFKPFPFFFVASLALAQGPQADPGIADLLADVSYLGQELRDPVQKIRFMAELGEFYQAKSPYQDQAQTVAAYEQGIQAFRQFPAEKLLSPSPTALEQRKAFEQGMAFIQVMTMMDSLRKFDSSAAQRAQGALADRVVQALRTENLSLPLQRLLKEILKIDEFSGLLKEEVRHYVKSARSGQTIQRTHNLANALYESFDIDYSVSDPQPLCDRPGTQELLQDFSDFLPIAKKVLLQESEIPLTRQEDLVRGYEILSLDQTVSFLKNAFGINGPLPEDDNLNRLMEARRKEMWTLESLAPYPYAEYPTLGDESFQPDSLPDWVVAAQKREQEIQALSVKTHRTEEETKRLIDLLETKVDAMTSGPGPVIAATLSGPMDQLRQLSDEKGREAVKKLIFAVQNPQTPGGMFGAPSIDWESVFMPLANDLLSENKKLIFDTISDPGEQLRALLAVARLCAGIKPPEAPKFENDCEGCGKF